MDLFDAALATEKEEVFKTLLEKDGVRIEKIVYLGQASPEGFWYDQAENEWVCLLSGSARVLVSGREVCLLKGDSLFLPAHEKHRVTYTDPKTPTVWLCVFWKG